MKRIMFHEKIIKQNNRAINGILTLNLETLNIYPFIYPIYIYLFHPRLKLKLFDIYYALCFPVRETVKVKAKETANATVKVVK